MFKEMWLEFCRYILSNYYDDMSIIHIQGPLNLRGPGAAAPSAS